MSALLQLLKPWAYLAVRGSHKSFFDWWAPVVVAVLGALAVLISGHRVNFYGAGGVVSLVTSFVQNLPGFFIAALAAVATFNRTDLDKLLPEPTPTIPIQARGVWVQVELTRRRFLSALFSFLTAQSIAITLLGIAFQTFAPWLREIAPTYLSGAIFPLGILIYLFLLSQLVTVTCLGLYYLGDRIHQPDES